MPSLHQMSCEEVARAVWAYLDDEIDADRASRIRDHLGICDHCRDLYTFEGAFLRTVARVLDESEDVSALRSRIVEVLRSQGYQDVR